MPDPVPTGHALRGGAGCGGNQADTKPTQPIEPMTEEQKRIHEAFRDKGIPCFRCIKTGNLRVRIAGLWVYVTPETNPDRLNP